MKNKFIIIGILIVAVVITSYVVVYSRDVESEIPPIEGLTSEDQGVSVKSQGEALDEVVDILSEEVGVLTEAVVRESLIGLWASLDREGYRVEFTAVGEMIETLEPSRMAGTWELVSFDEGPDEVVSTVAFSEEGVFLKQSLDEGRSSFYYKVVQVDQDRLVVLYLNVGGILGFDRIR